MPSQQEPVFGSQVVLSLPGTWSLSDLPEWRSPDPGQLGLGLLLQPPGLGELRVPLRWWLGKLGGGGAVGPVPGVRLLPQVQGTASSELTLKGGAKPALRAYPVAPAWVS